MYDAETTGQTHPDSLRVVGYHFRDEFLMIKHYTNLWLLCCYFTFCRLLIFACTCCVQGGYCLKAFAEGVALTLKCLLGDPCPDVGPLPAPHSEYACLLI